MIRAGRVPAGARPAPPPEVRVVEAGEGERGALEALLVPYLAELAAYEEPTGGPAAGDYPNLRLYWQEPGRHPFLILSEGRVAGFALVRRLDHGPDVLSVMAEFYVKPDERRLGVGRAAALQLLHHFPGPWRVRQLAANAPARGFWSDVLGDVGAAYVERRTESGGAVVAEVVVRPRPPRGTR